jgi:hypothetical protein
MSYSGTFFRVLLKRNRWPSSTFGPASSTCDVNQLERRTATSRTVNLVEPKTIWWNGRLGLTGSYYLGGMGLPRLIFIVCKLVGATIFQVLLLMIDFFDWTLSQMVKSNMDTHKIEMLLSYQILPPSCNFRGLWATNNTLVPGPVWH